MSNVHVGVAVGVVVVVVVVASDVVAGVVANVLGGPFVGVSPDGEFDRNTKIYYCCRRDGYASNAIRLPTHSAFYLFKYGDRCQEVLCQLLPALSIDPCQLTPHPCQLVSHSVNLYLTLTNSHPMLSTCPHCVNSHPTLSPCTTLCQLTPHPVNSYPTLSTRTPHPPQVKKMSVTEEWIYWADEKSMNLNSRGGVYPSMSRLMYPTQFTKLYYCFYQPEQGEYPSARAITDLTSVYGVNIN